MLYTISAAIFLGNRYTPVSIRHSMFFRLMGRIFSEFHKRSILGLYIFDALAVPMNRIDEARSIMNQIAKELEIGARVGIFKTIQSIAA